MLSPRTGYFTTSYRSRVDDSEQPFAMWVPRCYSRRRAWPLVVALHGMDGDERMIPEQCFRMHERGFREDVIVVCPFGRGDIGFRYMGETDFWDVVNWVRDTYRVDARRQYLTGLSMGGFATWRLACKYPAQWAATAPVCGGGSRSALASLRAPVWCVHGDRDELVPVEHSRKLVAELRRLKRRVRYDELAGWGHNSWDWLYDPARGRDSLVGWLLRHRRATPARRVREPRREGGFKDLFHDRLIISCPAATPIPREVGLLRAEAERIAEFKFGEYPMRSGRLLVKTDAELTRKDLAEASHLMLGRTDNHHWLGAAARKLLARHAKGTLRVAGEPWLGKSLLAATRQPSPWNPARQLGIITYQQVHAMQGAGGLFCGWNHELKDVNLYDTEQQRFIRQFTPAPPRATVGNGTARRRRASA